MPITININNLTLCHQGSDGVAMATLPDVCKTPPGPVPVPYPNIAFSKHLKKGTKTIKVDGGNMAANKGSEFSQSTGDEPGIAGGVKSSTHMKEATWLTYSFDVKLEGRNACRLTDKMLMNHGNTACLGGLIQKLLVFPETVFLCLLMCLCNECPIISSKGYKLKQRCIELLLIAINTIKTIPLRPEQTYNMLNSPPTPVPGKPTFPAGTYRRVDVVSLKIPFGEATQDNLKAVFEMKFPGDQESKPRKGRSQLQNLWDITGNDAEFEMLTVEKCLCEELRKIFELAEAAALIAALTVVLVDDASVVGVADDALIPVLVTRLGQILPRLLPALGIAL